MIARKKRRVLANLALAGLIAFAAASPAYAQAAGGDLGGFLQNVVDLLNNNIIRLLAVIAVIFTGGAWLLGHLDLRRAATVVLGVIVMFSAAWIVDLITGGG